MSCKLKYVPVMNPNKPKTMVRMSIWSFQLNVPNPSSFQTTIWHMGGNIRAKNVLAIAPTNDINSAKWGITSAAKTATTKCTHNVYIRYACTFLYCNYTWRTLKLRAINIPQGLVTGTVRISLVPTAIRWQQARKTVRCKYRWSRTPLGRPRFSKGWNNICK